MLAGSEILTPYDGVRIHVARKQFQQISSYTEGVSTSWGGNVSGGGTRTRRYTNPGYSIGIKNVATEPRTIQVEIERFGDPTRQLLKDRTNYSTQILKPGQVQVLDIECADKDEASTMLTSIKVVSPEKRLLADVALNLDLDAHVRLRMNAFQKWAEKSKWGILLAWGVLCIIIGSKVYASWKYDQFSASRTEFYSTTYNSNFDPLLFGLAVFVSFVGSLIVLLIGLVVYERISLLIKKRRGKSEFEILHPGL